MGRRGPAPTPTALKVLHGVRPGRINDSEPQPRPGIPDPPPILTAAGRRYWHDLVDELRHMRVLTRADADMLAVFANAKAEYEAAGRLVRRFGVVLRDGEGKPRTRNPAVTVREHNAALMHRLAREFGLTPSSRGGMVAPPLTSSGERPESLLS